MSSKSIRCKIRITALGLMVCLAVLYAVNILRVVVDRFSSFYLEQPEAVIMYPSSLTPTTTMKFSTADAAKDKSTLLTQQQQKQSLGEESSRGSVDHKQRDDDVVAAFGTIGNPRFQEQLLQHPSLEKTKQRKADNNNNTSDKTTTKTVVMTVMSNDNGRMQPPALEFNSKSSQVQATKVTSNVSQEQQPSDNKGENSIVEITNEKAPSATQAEPRISHGNKTWYLDQTTTTSTTSVVAPLKTTTATNKNFSPSFGITIDILSIGSKFQADLQQAQQETFGSHPAVRHFYAATEQDDSETDCDWNLKNHTTTTTTTTTNHSEWPLPSLLVKVVQHCRTSRLNMHPKKRGTYQPLPVLLSTIYAPRFRTLESFRELKNPAGWLCAQKRPMNAFVHLIDRYGYRNKSNHNYDNLPDYLFVMDDDTWMNLHHILSRIQHEYPVNKALAVGFEIMSFGPYFTIPWGGYGFFFTKGALKRWLRPLYCHKERFKRPFACRKILANKINEKHAFADGMTLADFMASYADRHAYRDVDQWKWNRGYCMHSDWTWGYFSMEYKISPAAPFTKYYGHWMAWEHNIDDDNDPLHNNNNSSNKSTKRCKKRKCANNAHLSVNCNPQLSCVCHNVTADQIRQFSHNARYLLSSAKHTTPPQQDSQIAIK